MAEERLCNLVRYACMKVSPFKFNFPDISKLFIQERGHILEVLYYCLVPLSATDDFDPQGNETEMQNQPDPTIIRKAFKSLWKAISSLNIGPVRLLTLRILPVLRALRGPITVILKPYGGENKDSPMGTTPTRDELDVPSVADLYSAGIKFLPTEGDLTTIRFDQKTATLFLPKLVLDTNAEVILRNLVAFEAAAVPGTTVFARYTDFMNGIIEKKEDVRLLRSRGIIVSLLESDGKAAIVWNGMGRCVKLTRVKYLDKVITDMNKYYGSRWNVAVKEYMRTNIFRSWKFLSLLSITILLLLTCLEAFCSVYYCQKWFDNVSFVEDKN